jgi:ATP-dependent DNA helicase RecQ
LLKDAGVVKEHRGAKFSLLRKDLDQAQIVEIAAEYENRGETDREKLEKMMLYAQSALCRWHILSEYFEAEKETEEAEEKAEKCGVCDNCANPIEERLGIETEAPVKFDERIIEQIKVNNPAFEKGETVETKANGSGKITEINGDKITVKFPGGAKKTFKKDYLKKNYVEKG